MRRFHLLHIQRNAQPGSIRHSQHPTLNPQWLLRQALTILPDPMRIDRRHFARRSSRHMRKTSPAKRRSDGWSASPTSSRVPGRNVSDIHRSLHRPEVRIGQRNIAHRMQFRRMAQLPPVGSDHIRRRRHTRRGAKLRQYLPSRRNHSSAPHGSSAYASTFCFPAAQPDCFFQRPRPIRVQRNARSGNRSASAVTTSISVRASQHTALGASEVPKPISGLRSASASRSTASVSDRLRRAAAATTRRLSLPRRHTTDPSCLLITNEEQISQNIHSAPLLPQQRRHRKSHELSHARSSSAASIAVTAWMAVRCRSNVCRPRPPASRSLNFR